MNDTGLAYADSVYVKTAGPEPYDYYFAVGYYYYRSDRKLGKILKLGVQVGSDAISVVAKVASDEKEILLVSNFFKANILCYDATAPYNGELEPFEGDE